MGVHSVGVDFTMNSKWFSFPPPTHLVNIYSLPITGPPLHLAIEHDPYRHLINN